MDKKLSFLVILCLICALLCACGSASPQPEPTPVPTPEPTPAPTYDPAPPLCDITVTIDGRELPACYGTRDGIYVRLADWEALGGLAQPDSESVFDGTDRYLPLKALTEGLTELEDEENSHLYYTRIPDVSCIPEGIKIPVLMYHAVSDDCWGIRELFVSPSEMEKQLQYLSDNGYTTITFEDLPNVADIEKPVMLTFDDGYLDNYDELFPLLQKYNAKATVFVISDTVYSEHYLKEAHIKEMSDSGLVSIQSHTKTHPHLSELGEEDTVTELAASRLRIAQLTGREPFVLCYPYGSNSDLTREVAAKYYSFGILMNGGQWVTGGDLFAVPRCYISRDTYIGSFAAMLN